MKIDPNDEATLPPLGECVVLITELGKYLGGRDAHGDEWLWVLQHYSPLWCDKKQCWELDGEEDDVQPVAWHPIGGEA